MPQPRERRTAAPVAPAALIAWQRRVQSSLLATTVPERPAEPARDGSIVRVEARAAAVSMPDEAGLAIYRRMIASRFHNVLLQAYPAVRVALGREGFDDAVREFVRDCPSTSFTLAHLGDGFGAFLDQRESAAWIAELARLEHARAACLDARPLGAPGGLPAAHEVSDWLGMGFAAPPTSRILDLNFRVDVWRARLVVGDRASAPASTRPERAPHRLAVYRVGGDVRCRRLESDEADLLVALRGGARLGEGVAAAMAASPTLDSMRLTDWLREWFELGLLAIDSATNHDRRHVE